MTKIGENIVAIKQELPADVRLVAVSKFHPIEALREAYAAGQRVFGESRVQEISAKHQLMPCDVEWHFIGHLQTNKVRQLVPYVTLIHGIDTEKLLRCVDAEARKISRRVDVLLQLHVARETTKFGFSCDDCLQLLSSGILGELPNVRICGVMGMATNTDDEAEVRREFHEVRTVFERLKAEFFAGEASFKEVSMGMSGDYRIAIEEGSTMVRVGTSIFGIREY